MELRQITEHRLVSTCFQPIVDGVGGTVIGYEALSRGPEDSLLHAPAALLAAAEAAGAAEQIDLLCLQLAIERFACAGLDGKLFLNLLPGTLLTERPLAQRLQGWLSAAGLRPHDIVLELTEHGLVREVAAVRVATAPLRDLGCEIAIDDLGAGSSGLKTWAEIRPDYVKIDRYFITAIEHDPVSLEVLRSVLDMAHVMGGRVIAEGVETALQCSGLVELGVDYLQGYFLGRPQANPQVSAEAAAQLAVCQAGMTANCAEQLAVSIPPVAPDTRIGEVVEIFQNRKDWDSLAVVRDGRPIGIVRRDDLLTLLSRPLYPEIFNRKPITEAMDPRPLVVDARARLDQVSRIVTRSARARVNEDFIIARHGSYIGLGRTIELLRQITAQRVQAAEQCNPLTLLPGNRQIQEQALRLLALRSPFVMCHVDLDHFKPYNDEYGYARGDHVLLHLAGLLKRSVCPLVDFVGHLGGDDFILMMRSADWQARLTRVFDSFCASISGFYRPEHRHGGGLVGADRDGTIRAFPLMTLSVAAVRVCGEGSPGMEQLSDRLRRAKSHAKAKAGHALFLDSGEDILDLPVGLRPQAAAEPAALA